VYNEVIIVIDSTKRNTVHMLFLNIMEKYKYEWLGFVTRT